MTALVDNSLYPRHHTGFPVVDEVTSPARAPRGKGKRCPGADWEPRTGSVAEPSGPSNRITADTDALSHAAITRRTGASGLMAVGGGHLVGS